MDRLSQHRTRCCCELPQLLQIFQWRNCLVQVLLLQQLHVGPVGWRDVLTHLKEYCHVKIFPQSSATRNKVSLHNVHSTRLRFEKRFSRSHLWGVKRCWNVFQKVFEINLLPADECIHNSYLLNCTEPQTHSVMQSSWRPRTLHSASTLRSACGWRSSTSESRLPKRTVYWPFTFSFVHH